MMELLNNIWGILTTPNELLINIILCFGMFVENYLCMFFFTSILNTSSSKIQKLLYIVLASVSGIISNYLIPTPYNIILNYFIIFILIYFIFKTSIAQSALSMIFPPILFALIGTLILNPLLLVLNISSVELATIPIYRILYLSIMYISSYFIILIIRYHSVKFNLLDSIDKKSKHIILITLILGILTLCIQLVITFYYIDVFPLIITFLSFLSLLAYFSISIYSLTRVIKLTLATKKLESAEEYNRTLHILHDNVRGFKHDFDNIVTTIGGYIKTNDMEGLEKYYTELVDDCQKVNNLYILNPEIINNPGIYNLLANKYHEAISKGIKVNMTFLLDLKDLKMKIYEFARILGILLDNAIEASSECEDKIINITFRNDQKNNRQLVIIENTYSNKDVNTSTIFGKGISEKTNHTGLGLWEVQNILKKNNNITLYTSKSKEFFSQQLEIY